MDPRFDVRSEDGAVVLRIRGDLDIAVEDAAVAAVADVLAADPRPGVVVLDLSEIEFMDSSGLRALLRMHNSHGAQFRLGSVSAVVERLLQLTGTLELFAPDEGRPPA
jgi:anti-sigma B factor antagonist